MHPSDALQFFQSPFFLSLSPLRQSQIVGGIVGMGLAALGFLSLGAAYFLCSRSWPCSGCEHFLDLNDNYLDWGLVFECKECGGRNVIRPRAWPAQWVVLGAVAAFDCWALFTLLHFRFVYKARYWNWAHPETFNMKPGDSDTWFVFCTGLACLYILYRVFIREEGSG